MPLSNWPPTPFCCCANPAHEWVGRCVAESPPAPAPTTPGLSGHHRHVGARLHRHHQVTAGFLPGCNFYAQTREPLPIGTLAPGCLNPAAHCTKQSPASGIEVGIVQIVPIHSLTNRLSPQMLGRFGDPKKAGSSRTQSRWRRLEHATASGTLDKRLANHTRLRLAFRRIAAYLRLEYAGNGNACARKLFDLRPPIFQRGVIAIAAANNRRPRARQISAIEMVNGFQGSFS